MAPELFKDDGVHSHASDLWALGCVLYECFVGRPPFMGREFTQLVKSILSDPTPILPGTPSRPFVNLINSLLVKDPAERIQWPELCGHAFWRTKITPVSLPPHPAFANMIDQNSKPCLSERNGEKLSQNRTPPKYREKDAKGTLRQNENSAFGSSKNEMLVKGTPGSQKTQSKVSSKVKVVEERKLKETPSASKGVNLLRLSRIAKSNLQRENDKENYRRPVPSNTENDSEVEIKNTDMELDFNENVEDESNDEPDESDNLNCNQEDISPNQNPPGKMEEAQNMGGDISDYSLAVNMNALDRSNKHIQDPPLVRTEVVATSPSPSPQLKNQRTKEGPTYAFDPDSLKACNNLSEFFWHQSDLSVKPVMPSRKADRISDANATLPFEGLQAPEFAKMPKEQQDALSSRIIATLSGNTSIGEKQNMIRYLEMLSNHADAANILTNGPIMLMIVKMLKQSKVLLLRIQLTSLIGLLIRHSTFIENDLANSGLLVSLTDGLRDKQEKVRRFSMAAIGELLFYISTQEEQNSNANPLESPLKDTKSPSGWQVN